MKFIYRRTLQYTDVDPDYRVKLSSLTGMLQEAAIRHSEHVGVGPRWLKEQGLAWILHKLGVEVDRQPVYGDTLVVKTWARQMVGFKAHREFEVLAGKRRVAVAGSVWLLWDIAGQKLRRLPPELSQHYTIETDVVFGENLDRWKPAAAENPDHRVDITTRSSDYDPNGHVNNAVYMDYLATLISQHAGCWAAVRRFKIEYRREIDRTIQTIEAVLKNSDAEANFQFGSADRLFAAGSVQVVAL